MLFHRQVYCVVKSAPSQGGGTTSDPREKCMISTCHHHNAWTPGRGTSKCSIGALLGDTWIIRGPVQPRLAQPFTTLRLDKTKLHTIAMVLLPQ